MKNTFRRKNGVIMPVFSLASKHGIGTFGKAAYDFVEFLSKSGVGYWQILPLGPTSYGDSPYQSFSSFAGNPYFIDLDILVDENLLKKEDLDGVIFTENESYVDYAMLYNKRFRILKKAFENIDTKTKEEIENFRKEESYWIEDYALFMALKRDQLDQSWVDFDEKYKRRDKKALEEFSKTHTDEIDFHIFMQYEFFKQWNNLKAFANRHEIQIIGDIPIYVAFDSCDSWVNGDILKLDENLKPEFVAGCPPDGFSDDGQLWGNPVYDWEKLKESDFEFWINRIKVNHKLFDIIRLDHFRGFEAYYEIDARDDSAKYGSWKKAYGDLLFEKIKKELPDVLFIAEDLGFITDEVRNLKDKYEIAGMKVLQFAFSEDMKSEYLPYNYDKNSICYSSTHDSDTLSGWLLNLDKQTFKRVKDYFDLKEDENYTFQIIKQLMGSVCQIAMFQMQDLLNYDNHARINVPSTLGENWKWRSSESDFTEELAQKIKNAASLYGRI